MTDTYHQFTSALNGNAFSEHLLQPLPGLTPADQLSIYQASIQQNLQNALLATFGQTLKLLGDVFIKGLTQQFVAAHQCQSHNLNQYAQQLCDYAAAIPAIIERHPYLPDFMRLECAYDKAYHGQAAVPFDLTQLTSLAPAQQAEFIFQLQPDSTLLASDYPIVSLWQLIEGDDGFTHHQLPDKAEFCYVFRQDNVCCLRLISQIDYQLLYLLEQGVSFGELFDELSLPHEQVSSTLINAIAQGWIKGTNNVTLASCQKSSTIF